MNANDGQKSVWPNRFPFGRAAVALLVVPLFSNLLLLLWMDAWDFCHPSPGAGPFTLRDAVSLEQLYAIGFSVVFFSWPGYLGFLLLGLPTLYFLYLFKRDGFILFTVFGACYTFLPWVIFGFGPHAHANTLRLQLISLWDEFKAIGSLGAVNGILTRLIVLGLRRS